MKSLFYRGALLLSLCVSSAVSAQESVVITMGYLPDREYLIFDESEKVARSETQGFDGSSDSSSKAGSSVKIVEKTVKRTSIKTSEREENGSFTMTSNLLDMKVSLKRGDDAWQERTAPIHYLIQKGFIGVFAPDGEFSFISVGGRNFTSEMLDGEILIRFNSLNSDMARDFKINLGETVKIRVPLGLSADGQDESEMEMINEFTLDRVDAGMAYLSVQMRAQMTSGVDGAGGNGTAKGYMVYDIQKQYTPEFYTEMDINKTTLTENGFVSEKMKSNNRTSAELIEK